MPSIALMTALTATAGLFGGGQVASCPSGGCGMTYAAAPVAYQPVSYQQAPVQPVAYQPAVAQPMVYQPAPVQPASYVPAPAYQYPMTAYVNYVPAPAPVAYQVAAAPTYYRPTYSMPASSCPGGNCNWR